MTESISIDRATLHLTGAELAIVIKYLHEGPFKEVSPVVHKIEEQILSQWKAKQQRADDLSRLDELRHHAEDSQTAHQRTLMP